MEHLLAHAQGLVYTLMGLMPSTYQQDSLKAMLELFLRGDGHPLPQRSQLKSPAALSRFLNKYPWPTRKLVREIRRAMLCAVLNHHSRGRRPWVQLIVDLTTLEKTGKFKQWGLVRVFHGKRGIHLVVLYLVVGRWRLPWSFCVYRGKGTPSVAKLALKLLRRLPKSWSSSYRVLVLADAAFGSCEFVRGVRRLGYHTLVGISCRRCLADGRSVKTLHKRGSQVRLKGLKVTVAISWFYFKREQGQ